jgi:hypothetical protein
MYEVRNIADADCTTLRGSLGIVPTLADGNQR